MASEGKGKRLQNAVCDKVSVGDVICFDMVDQVNEHVNTLPDNSCVIFEGAR